MSDMKKYNQKWLAYMAKQDIKTVTKCPNGHKLLAYIPKNYGYIVITCPKGPKDPEDDAPMCDYFDYNTYRVPIGTELAMEVEEH